MMLKTKRLLFYSAVWVLLLVTIVLSLILPFQVSVSTNKGFLSLNIDRNRAEAQIPETPNVVMEVKGDAYTPTDLSSKDWVNETKVGYKLSAEALPPNVFILGTPLLKGESVTCLELIQGGISYYQDGLKIFQCLPRITVDGKSTDLIISGKTLDASSDQLKKSQTVGYSGTLADGTHVSVSIWASPIRDDTGEKISFTPIVDLPAFTYDYIFTVGEDITAVRYFENVPPQNNCIVHEVLLDKDVTGDLGNANGLRFLDADGKDKGGYSFYDVASKADRVIWSVTKGQFIVSFYFSGLKAGETFNNDGYFGLSSGDNTWGESQDVIQFMKFANSVGAGTLTSIGLLFDDTTPNGNVRIGIYSEAGSLLLDAGAAAVANSWVTISSLSLSVAASTNYWLAYLQSVTNGVRYQTGGAANSHNWLNQAYGALPATFGPGSGNTNQYVMRAYVTTSGSPAITNTPATRAFGTLYNSQTYYSNNLTLGYAPTFALADAQCYFTITNSGTASGNISAKATNFTGGTTLSLTDAAPGATTLRLSLYKSGDADSSANITLTTTNRLFITSLAASATKKWEIRLETPTSDQNDANQKTCTITFTISSP